jgi:hypothetical protein
VALAETILGLGLLYLACGLLFGVPFVAVGLGRIDHAARRTSLLFRLLLLPGTAVFWPLLAAKWVKIYKEGGKP